jgi:hypothetical protein
VTPISSEQEAIAAVRDRLLQRGKLPLKEWLTAKDTAQQLVQFAEQRIRQIAQQLNVEIGGAGKGYHFSASAASLDRADEVLTKVTQKAGHHANFEDFNALVQLFLNTDRRDWFALTFHSVGPRYRGIIGVLAYLAVQGKEPELIEGGGFQINYEEASSTAQTRFSAWLEHMIVEGLNAWRRSL